MFFTSLWFFDLLPGLRERFSNVFEPSASKETQFSRADLYIWSEDLYGTSRSPLVVPREICWISPECISHKGGLRIQKRDKAGVESEY